MMCPSFGLKKAEAFDPKSSISTVKQSSLMLWGFLANGPGNLSATQKHTANVVEERLADKSINVIIGVSAFTITIISHSGENDQSISFIIMISFR